MSKSVRITESTWRKIKGSINQGDLSAMTAPRGQTQREIIRVYNNSGAAVGRFGILGIGGVQITPDTSEVSFLSGPIIKGDTPSTTTHADGKFVICQTPIAVGGIGQAVMSGLSIVEVYVSNEAHGFADIDNENSANLISAASSSCQILWKESGTGLIWAIVRLGGGSIGGKWFKVISVASGVMTCYEASYSVAGGWVQSGSTAVSVYPHASIGASGIHHYPAYSYIYATLLGGLWIAEYTFPFYFPKYEELI